MFFRRFPGKGKHRCFPPSFSLPTCELPGTYPYQPRLVLQRNPTMGTLVHIVDGHQKNAQDKMVGRTEVYFLTVLQTGKSKIKAPPAWLLVNIPASPSSHRVVTQRLLQHSCMPRAWPLGSPHMTTLIPVSQLPTYGYGPHMFHTKGSECTNSGLRLQNNSNYEEK